MGQLDRKIAIITGAATGIGKGITFAYGKEGATLVLASRNEENLKNCAHELESTGVNTLVIPTDVSIEVDVINLFKRTMEEFGRVDILVNNAGVFDGGPLDTISLNTWKKVIDVNLTGTFLCSREAMKIMKKQRFGRIINIGSISSKTPRLNDAPYVTSKHALVGLTKATALDGREFGVTASCLHPGNVITERRSVSNSEKDQEPMMMPADIAMAAVMMAALPPYVNMLEAIVLPVAQEYIGRG
jgi:NAD(P)-dependent dehydrogenase (short-subunit alcohol dehydrogenase family)